MWNRYLRPGVSLLLFMTALLGVAYPLLVLGLGRLAFASQAQGSLVHSGGVLVGSTLIGQSFSEPRYFWGRPSATSPQPYNAGASGGSNLGPLNPALADRVGTRVQMLRAADPGNTLPIPVDLVTASASGLDPEISIAAARYQAARVARQRGLAREAVMALILRHQRHPLLGIIGEARVNVLELNLALDQLH